MDKFFDFLWEEPIGRIILINIVDSIRLDILDSSTIKKHVNTWKTSCTSVASVPETIAKMRLCRESEFVFLKSSKIIPEIKAYERLSSIDKNNFRTVMRLTDKYKKTIAKCQPTCRIFLVLT